MEFKPTYFGKTTKPDPIAYKGSGTVWLRHIKKHGGSSNMTRYHFDNCKAKL